MSDETKWTKGPWVVGQSAWDEFELCVDTGYGCEPTGMPNEICPIASSHHDGEWGAEDKANAHLIAAAPELAEVARKLIEDYEAWQRDDMSPHEIGDIVDEARDAYAKARGETS